MPEFPLRTYRTPTDPEVASARQHLDCAHRDRCLTVAADWPGWACPAQCPGYRRQTRDERMIETVALVEFARAIGIDPHHNRYDHSPLAAAIDLGAVQREERTGD